MKLREILILSAACIWGAACDGCDTRIKNIAPSIAVVPTALDVGSVKVGASGPGVLRLQAKSNAPVTISKVSLEGGDASAFKVSDSPLEVPALGEEKLALTFSPTEYRAYLATLVIESNDNERPTVRVPVVGQGVSSKILVTPTCELSRGCQGTAKVDPPSIDFGREPLVRLLPIPVTQLPQVAIVNNGDVDLNVTKTVIEGADAAAFSIVGNVQIPTEGFVFGKGEGINFSIRFVPTSKTQLQYQAVLRVDSDDQENGSILVPLTGELRPNLPPTVCANIIEVVPGDGSATVRYDGPDIWNGLKAVPPDGYDFSTSRDIRPASIVTFSAISNASDVTQCTSDPEDGRTGLSFDWKVTGQPSGTSPLVLGNAQTPIATLRPKELSGFATGNYTVELTVKDSQGASTTVFMHFVIALKEDFVVQLSWPGFSNVDLDLHLIRPSAVLSPGDPFSGAFSFFETGPLGKTAGDIHGYAASIQKSQTGFDFDWGDVGTPDDPRLNLDDKGGGELIENISLNYPENDPLCAASSCTYKIMVHYFKDGRDSTSALACNVTGTSCQDGEACDCADAKSRCVGNTAPKGGKTLGAGLCLEAPTPSIKIFFKGSPTPAQVVPLETDLQTLGAPCQLFYLADVVWPQRGSTAAPWVVLKGANAQNQIANPQLRRFGRRSSNSLQCSSNVTVGSVNWYAAESQL